MGLLDDIASRVPTNPNATWAGVTASPETVERMLAECGSDEALAVDMQTTVRQARLIAGEDDRLAIVLVTAFRACLGRQLHAYVSADGFITNEDIGFSYFDSQTGAAVACLQILAFWPDNPLDVDWDDDDLLTRAEDRVMELFNTAARVLGIEADT